MRQENDFPLTPALLELLRASAAAKTTRSRVLAEILSCTTGAVDMRFKRLFELLDVHSCSEVVYMAVEKGWIKPGASGS